MPRTGSKTSCHVTEIPLRQQVSARMITASVTAPATISLRGCRAGEATRNPPYLRLPPMAGCAALHPLYAHHELASLPQEVAGDDDAHDLVGAFEDLVHPDVAQIALDREVLQIAIAAMQLQRL